MFEPTHENLDGHVALISGANRGLGAQTAVKLAAAGAIVYAGARNPATLTGLSAESGGKIRPVVLDVTSEASIENAIAQVIHEAGRLDVLVNNAGIGDWHGVALHTLDTELMDEVIQTNLRGPMLLAKHALPYLLESTGDGNGPDGALGAGRIVTVSSGMGALLEGMSGSAPTYRVTKTAVNGLTAYLEGEYGMRGLIAASVCPGWVRTDMGGENAPRSLDEGANGIAWLCMLAPGATSGKFWRDRVVIDW
jgi:NAD(P)-dependent dehydrogenase (short-subunit alcohol dehydrogenase family)